MAKKVMIHIATESGEQTIVLRKHILRNSLLAAGLITTLLAAGSLVGAKFFRDNQGLVEQVNHLTTRLDDRQDQVNADLQKQVDTLKRQLERAKLEMAVKTKRKSELIKQYEQQIDQLKKTQKELLTTSVKRLNERAKSIESAMDKLGVDIPIKDDPKHSGGLYVAMPGKKQNEQLLKETGRYLQTMESLPLGRPIATEISSVFGHRSDPLNQKQAFHEGLDFRGNVGDPVASTGGGRVVESEYAPDYGNYILVSHGNGLETFFAHLSKRMVKQGEQVAKGQIIGLVGKTGRSTGAHLHYEIRHKKQPVDPMKFIKVAQAKMAK